MTTLRRLNCAAASDLGIHLSADQIKEVLRDIELLGRKAFIDGYNHVDKPIRGMWSQNYLKDHAVQYGKNLFK